MHDPDDVAPELWNEASDTDSASELIRALSPIAQQYADYYDVSFEEAAYRAAGESLDWWPHGDPRSIRWAPDVLRLVLYPENVPRMVDHIESMWERCDDHEDGLKLIDEAALGTGMLQMGPPELRSEDTFPPESGFNQPTSKAGEVWTWVFDTDVTRRHGPMRRAGELLDIADIYVDERGLSHEAAIRETVQTYVDARSPAIVFYEAMKLHWDPYTNPLDERFTREWNEGIDGLSWLQSVATVLLEWKLTEDSSDIRSYLDTFGL